MRIGSSALLISALVLCGCAHRVASPTEALDEAAKSASNGSADGRTLALAGFHAYLVKGNPAQARKWFSSAVDRAPSDPYGHFGQLLLADHDGHPAAALKDAFALCEHAPAHPLCASAARLIRGSVGMSAVLDEMILHRASALLAKGLSGDAGFMLREARAVVFQNRREVKSQSKALADAGLVTHLTLVGPLSPFHVLDFDSLTAIEKTSALTGPWKGPFGAVTPRQLAFPDGRIDLDGEPDTGDVYLMAVDVTVPSAGIYVVRAQSQDSLIARIDGLKLFERRGFARAASSYQAASVRLSKGTHRLLVKLSKPDRDQDLALSVAPASGSASKVRMVPAKGAAPKGATALPSPAANLFPTPEKLAAALRPEVGEMLADFIAIQDGADRDPDESWAILHRVGKVRGAAFLSLRARLEQADRNLPQRIANARATRDLEAAIAQDPTDVDARLRRAHLALGLDQTEQASSEVKGAEKAHAPVGAPALMLHARIYVKLGLDAEARGAAERALAVEPGLCNALALGYDLADRHHAIARRDAALQALRPCPQWRGRALAQARTTGDSNRAIAIVQRWARLAPEDTHVAFSLASLYVGQKRYAEAEALLQRLLPDWPHDADVLERMGAVQALAGRKKASLATREKALALDGGNLALRRLVTRQKTGHELLADLAQDGQAAIARYEKLAPNETAASALVLDAAATQVYPDGSMVDRIHTITKVLDQSAISDVAEVNIPPGAQVLELRAIQPDGGVLEPEPIAGKSTVSLPGVEVGDYVEEEYLLAHDPRTPVLPGFTSSNFYYQVANTPDHFSTFVVRAPKDVGLKVDAHNVKVSKVRAEGNQEVFSYTVKDSPPFIAEPDAPPMPNEYLPFVSVGSGATGEGRVAALYSDAFFSRAKRTEAIDRFARKVVAGKTGKAAVEALYAAVMERIASGRSGLAQSASAALATGRGRRLWLLKASLAAVGIPSRVAAVRTFSVDPSPYLFPNPSLLPYLCLRVDLSDGTHVWLDPMVRFAPFGALPESAAGRTAWLLPEPGKPEARIQTPEGSPVPPKEITLKLSLDAQGNLTGEGTETYRGFDAARIADALRKLNPAQRQQALQGALSHYFGGATLSGLQLEMKKEVGAPLTVRYRLEADHFGRISGNRMVLGPLTFPSQLGRHYVEVGSRSTPLYIGETSASKTHVTLTLPEGYRDPNPLAHANVKSAWGHYLRHEQTKAGTLSVDEDFRLKMARVPVKAYEKFADFAGQVDLLQSRDIHLERAQVASIRPR